MLHTRAWYYMHVFADPVDENTVYIMNAPFMKSVDGGETFSRISAPHGDQHYLWINPNEPRWMVNANDGGANVSFDGGASWSRQDNQPTAQFYRVNTDNRFEYRVYGGQQDLSTVAIKSRSRDGAIGRDDWEVHGGGESAHFGLDPENPRYTYAGFPWGRIEEFDTETRTTRSVRAYEELGRGVQAGDQKYRFNWNAPIVVSQHDSDVIFHAANVLLKSTDRGYSWQPVSPDLTRNEPDKHGEGAGPYTNENLEMYNTIFAVEESPQDADTIWAGTDGGLLHVTRDGGETWSEVTPRGVGRGMINSIDASEHVPGVAYVTAIKYKEGDNAPYAWRTDDYGQSWNAHRRRPSSGAFRPRRARGPRASRPPVRRHGARPFRICRRWGKLAVVAAQPARRADHGPYGAPRRPCIGDLGTRVLDRRRPFPSAAVRRVAGRRRPAPL